MSATPGDAIDISVVVSADRDAGTLTQCLDSVQRALEGRSGEIIVVAGPGSHAAGIARERFPHVRVIESAVRLSAGAARNRGVDAARGRLIFLTDHDCVVPPDWVQRLGRHLADPAVGSAGGSVGIQNPGSLSGCAAYFLEFLYHFPSRRPPARNSNFMVGCNSAYAVAALRSVRFADQTLGEDVLLSHHLLKRGFAIIYDPRVEVRRHDRTAWSGFFEGNRKLGRSAAAYHSSLHLRWVEPFFRQPLFIYLSPFVVLPSIGFDLARSRWSYFLRFLVLSPMCFLGNLAWAHGFRRQVLETRAPGPPAAPGRD